MTNEQKELNDDLDLDFILPEDKTVEAEDTSATVPAVESKEPSLSETHAAKQALAEKAHKLSLFHRIPVTLTLEVASTEMSLAELMSINNTSVVELNKLAGEPLDIKVNGILFGKAEVVVCNDKYGLRILELNNRDLDELAL